MTDRWRSGRLPATVALTLLLGVGGHGWAALVVAAAAAWLLLRGAEAAIARLTPRREAPRPRRRTPRTARPRVVWPVLTPPLASRAAGRAPPQI